MFAPPSAEPRATDLGLKFSMICSVTRVVISTSYLPFSIDVLFSTAEVVERVDGSVKLKVRGVLHDF